MNQGKAPFLKSSFSPSSVGVPLLVEEGLGEEHNNTLPLLKEDKAINTLPWPFPKGKGTKLAVGVLLLLVCAPLTGWAKPPNVGTVPELKFTPPKPERVTLSNGIVVYLLEDHELPLFSLSLSMKTSPADLSDSEREALSFLGGTWRTGGTKTRKPNQLNEELETMPASLDVSTGEESYSISLSCLSRDKDQGLAIWADVLLNPSFRSDQLALLKVNTLESLRRKNETPAGIGRRAFRDVLYGPTHLYARNALPATVKKVKRSQLVKLHKKVVVPDHAYLTIWGDFDKKALLAQLETLLADWEPIKREVPPYNYALKNPKDGSLFYVEKDFNQSRIYIGRIGITRHHPDEYALAVANYILGGGGPSRLFAEIRSRLGLAYVVGSFFTKSKGPGLVGVGCQTKAPTTVKAIKAILKEMDQFVSAEPTDEEMTMAKDSIINAFVFRFENSENIVREQTNLEFFGYPSDYLETYPDKIRALTKKDILTVAKKYFSKENRKIVVVGDKAKFEEPLSSLGPMVTIPLEDVD